MMERKSKLQPITTVEDWLELREVYVVSFLHYPLYKYMVPDLSKREAFLRAYLDANYEATVGSGQGICLGLWVAEKQKVKQAKDYKLVGGVILVLPSCGGSGWSVQDDEIYWKAYEKYKLADISEEGMNRVKRYEAWEFDVVTARALHTGVPMWNGIFIAILPEYTAQGFATRMFNNGIRILSGVWTNQQKKSGVIKTEKQAQDVPCVNKLSTGGANDKPTTTLFSAQMARQTTGIDADLLLKKLSSAQATSKPVTKAITPLLLGVCHSEKSKHFYTINGFKKVSETLYSDQQCTFPVSVYICDPFKPKSHPLQFKL